MKTRLGIIGSGVIGGKLYRQITSAGDAVVTCVYDADRGKTAGIPPELLLVAAKEMATRGGPRGGGRHPKAVREFGPTVLRKDPTPFLTAFSDDLFGAQMQEAAHAAGKAIDIPHSAWRWTESPMGGKVLESVRVTTVKPPKSLGISPDGIDRPVAIYDGSTQGACDKFPRNVNVHAAVALAGLGFDRTRPTIVADPGTNLMAHTIEVMGTGLRWRIEVESRSVGRLPVSIPPGKKGC